MPARPLLAAALAALALAAGGCTASGSGGGGSSVAFTGAQHDVAGSVEDLQSAGSKGDQDEVCSRLLSRMLVDRLDARGGCRKVVDAALKDTDTSDLKVTSVSITGSTATARVTTDTGDGTKAATLRLVREAGRWKLTGF